MFKENLEFHIQEDDYFATLATVLDLQVQGLRPEAEGVNLIEFLKRIEDTNRVLKMKVEELMHLQKHYKIVKR